MYFLKIRRYINVNPVQFQIEDIMEISITFFCVQIHGQKMKMMTSLKTLTMLDDKIQQVIFFFFYWEIIPTNKCYVLQKARDNHVKELLLPNVTTLHIKHQFIETEEDASSIKHACMDIT